MIIIDSVNLEAISWESVFSDRVIVLARRTVLKYGHNNGGSNGAAV